MNTTLKIAAAFVALSGALMSGTPNAAAATLRKYSVPGYGQTEIMMKVCTTDAAILLEGDHSTDLDFIVYDEDTHHRDGSGNAIEKVLPWLGVESTHTRPRCLSITSFTIARPTPVPSYTCGA